MGVWVGSPQLRPGRAIWLFKGKVEYQVSRTRRCDSREQASQGAAQPRLVAGSGGGGGGMDWAEPWHEG